MIATDAQFASADHARAVLNILEDFAAEKERLQDAQRAVLNILEDSGAEQQRRAETERAVLNILDDLATEKDRLEETKQEVVRSEKAVRISLREKEVLLKEIHHRVKNNLQVISSLLNLQARFLADPAAREIFRKSQDRVQSIALVHERLYQSANLSHIDFTEYAVTLVDNLFHTHDAAERGITRALDFGNISLAIDLAIPCGLIINELVTNCLKHAFHDRDAGRINIQLRRLAQERLELSVSDDGVGMPAGIDPMKTQSLGLDLVATFAEQIDAQLEIERNHGTLFRFIFAADHRGS